MTTRTARRPEEAARRIEIETDWEPSSLLQFAVLQAPERFITAFGGRRVGKSDVIFPWLTGIHDAWAPGQPKWGAVWIPGGRFLYTAPQRSPNALAFYKKLKEVLADLIVDKSDVFLWCKLFNDAEISCKSTERPDNLRGSGYDGIASDEIGTTPEDAYTVLRPTLSDPAPDGRVRRWLQVGSTRGKKHWSYGQYLEGQRGHRGPQGHVSFAYPTLSRPGMEAEVEVARRSYPENFFRQEYGCEFLENAAGYFDLVAEAHDGLPPPEKPESGTRHAAGFDFAHVDDWSVVVVIQSHPKPMRVVAMLRFSRCPWPVTKARGIDILKRWSADVEIDATAGGAPGDVITDAFRPEWTRVHGFDFRAGGGAGREALLQNLAVMLSTGELKLPGTARAPAFPELTRELEGFQYEVLPSGKARGTAGPNLDDDCVMALALAAWRAKQGGGGYASIKHWV